MVIVGGGSDDIDVVDNTEGGMVIVGGGSDDIEVVDNTQGGMVIVGGNDGAIDTLQFPLDRTDVIDAQPSDAMEVVPSGQPLPVSGHPREIAEPDLAMIAIATG